MKEKIRQILREKQLELDLQAKSNDIDETKYDRCSRYEFNTKYKNLCLDLASMGAFLHRDLGLKDIINSKLRLMGEIRDLNQQYQKPLSILYNKPRFDEIEKISGEYYVEHLKNKVVLFDELGQWHHVNKLNTNYSDLAELLTELFIRSGNIKDMVNKNSLGLRKHLLSQKENLKSLMDEHFQLEEYKEFVRNTKTLSERGERAENEVKLILEKIGFKTLYQGGHGDFIDMIFGIDLIMDYNGKIFTIQVKNSESQALKASEQHTYRRVDYFASPTNFGMVIKNREGEITKLDKDGKVINDSE
jgi:hypothetical protein